MRAKRKQIKNVRCYEIGSRDSYPHWLKKAIAQDFIKIENSVGGLIDVATFYRGKRIKHFYGGDFIVKLPEGPVIGVDRDKFYELYEPQYPDAWVIDIVNKTSRCPDWALEALKQGKFKIIYTEKDVFLQFKNNLTYYTKNKFETVSYNEVFGDN